MNFFFLFSLFFSSGSHNSWTIQSSLPKSLNKILKFNILLKQQNLDILENELVKRSDPFSNTYGKWLTKTEIDNIIKPDDYTPLYDWLKDHNVNIINNTDNLECSASIYNVQKLFNIELDEKFNPIYSLPEYIEPHVDMVLGFGKNYSRKRFTPKNNRFFNNVSVITPESIRTLYNISHTFPTKFSSQSVVEFLNDECYNNDNLQVFLQNNNMPNSSIPENHFWGNCSVNTSDPDIEATLDIQYQTGINNNSHLYYISVSDWLYQFSNTVYNSTSPPKVISMSYGWAEWDQCDPNVFPTCLINVGSEQYTRRTNTEFIKLGLRGITLVASSGDAGAPGRMNEQCEGDKMLNPAFPASSPWVLAVGGTIIMNSSIIKNPKTPLCQNYSCISGGEELNCNYDRCGWTSGGGFSNYFNRPAWQVEAANTYLDNKKIFPPQKYFNNQGRIYPDISLVSHNFLINTPSGYSTVDGTSASAPSISAMIGILNNMRVSKGLSTLGPVGPLLYTMQNKCDTCFKDITIGSNNSSEFTTCKWGYSAAVGFDAVYGLGVPNFDEMYKYVNNINN